MERSRNLNRLSECNSFTIPQVQSEDLSFYQNAILRSQGNFSKAKKSQGKVIYSIFCCIDQNIHGTSPFVMSVPETVSSIDLLFINQHSQNPLKIQTAQEGLLFSYYLLS